MHSGRSSVDSLDRNRRRRIAEARNVEGCQLPYRNVGTTGLDEAPHGALHSSFNHGHAGKPHIQGLRDVVLAAEHVLGGLGSPPDGVKQERVVNGSEDNSLILRIDVGAGKPHARQTGSGVGCSPDQS